MHTPGTAPSPALLFLRVLSRPWSGLRPRVGKEGRLLPSAASGSVCGCRPPLPPAPALLCCCSLGFFLLPLSFGLKTDTWPPSVGKGLLGESTTPDAQAAELNWEWGGAARGGAGRHRLPGSAWQGFRQVDSALLGAPSSSQLAASHPPARLTHEAAFTGAM